MFGGMATSACGGRHPFAADGLRTCGVTRGYGLCLMGSKTSSGAEHWTGKCERSQPRFFPHHTPKDRARGESSGSEERDFEAIDHGRAGYINPGGGGKGLSSRQRNRTSRRRYPRIRGCEGGGPRARGPVPLHVKARKMPESFQATLCSSHPPSFATCEHAR